MISKRHLTITLLLIFFSSNIYSQQISDSLKHAIPDTVFLKAADTVKPNIKDTLTNNVKDTTRKAADTLVLTRSAIRSYHSIVDPLLSINKFINVKQPAFFFVITNKQWTAKEFTFYALCAVIFILGLFKTFYNSYFNNLFRVFFNTSIRQTQLTDQLMQAKLPSFILNIFFTISAGIYIWLLFKYYHPPRLISSQLLLPFCIAGVGVLYFIKYCILKFMGWMSGMQQAADSYIFVIFLVNKITGIILVPFIILLAFSISSWLNSILILSLLVVGLFFLSRYVKTFGVLEYRFPLAPLHFIIYVAAVEVVPILLIYKLVVDYVI